MAKDVIHIERTTLDGSKVISVRIKEGTLKKIDALSEKSNRSRNELINILLESAVDSAQVR